MKNKVLATILFSLLVVPLVQSADNSPRLVVGITVDQLRTDYLEALQHLFGEKGFKRLMREGVVCENLVFDFPNLHLILSIVKVRLLSSLWIYCQGSTNTRK